MPEVQRVYRCYNILAAHNEMQMRKPGDVRVFNVGFSLRKREKLALGALSRESNTEVANIMRVLLGVSTKPRYREAVYPLWSPDQYRSRLMELLSSIPCRKCRKLFQRSRAAAHERKCNG